MIKLDNWSPSIQYEKKDIVIFHNKIYIANINNEGILPPPMFNYEDVVDSSGTDLLVSTNYDVLLELILAIWQSDPDQPLTQEQINSHLNTNNYWVPIQ